MQGDTLAPFLFILVIDQILRHLKTDDGVTLDASLPSRPVRCPAFAYADDVILLAHSIEAAQRLLTSFEQAAKKWGLLLNTKKGKTELLLVAHPSLLPNLSTDLYAEKGPVGTTKYYKYLGWHLTNRGALDWEDDWKRRKRAAWLIVHKHARIWRSGINLKLKRRMFVALVAPILQYAFWTYPDTKTVLTRTHVDTSALLRHCLQMPIRALEPHLHHHTEDLYDDVTPFLAFGSTKSLLQQWGHWVRHTPEAPVLQALTGTVHSKKKRARPHLPSTKLQELTGLTPEELVLLPEDRAIWKRETHKAALKTGKSIATIVLERRIGESSFDWSTRLSNWLKK